MKNNVVWLSYNDSFFVYSSSCCQGASVLQVGNVSDVTVLRACWCDIGKVLFAVNIHGNKWQMYTIFREFFCGLLQVAVV